MRDISNEVQGAFKASGSTLQEVNEARGINKNSVRNALCGHIKNPDRSEKSIQLRRKLLIESKEYLVDALRTVCQALKDEGAA